MVRVKPSAIRHCDNRRDSKAPHNHRVVNGTEIPDGEFGPTTEKAVKAFQSLKSLKADGEIGADTWTALLTT